LKATFFESGRVTMALIPASLAGGESAPRILAHLLYCQSFAEPTGRLRTNY